MNCKTCLYWSDYSDRVYATLSFKVGDIGGSHELRKCKYLPPPVMIAQVCSKYTNENYGCSAWRNV